MRRWALLLPLAACAAPTRPQAINERALLYELREGDAELGAGALSPEEAVAVALLHNPELRAFRSERRIAAAEVVSARLKKNPQLRLELKNLLSGNPLALAGALRFYPTAPGEQAARERQARAREQKVEAEIEDLENQVAAETLIAHAQLSMLDEKRRLLGATRGLHERLVELERQRLAVRQATRLDLLRAELGRDEVEDRLLELELDRQAAQARLARAMGASGFEAGVRASTATTSSPWAQMEEPELELVALDARPDLRALKRAIEDREQRVVLARARSGPWPGFVQPALTDLPVSARLDTEVSIDLPVYQSAEQALGVLRAEADRAKAALGSRVQQIRVEIHAARARLAQSEARRAYYRERIEPRMAEAEALLKAAMESGEVDAVDLQKVGLRLLDSRAAGAEARYQWQRARIELALALGTVLDATP